MIFPEALSYSTNWRCLQAIMIYCDINTDVWIALYNLTAGNVLTNKKDLAKADSINMCFNPKNLSV